MTRFEEGAVLVLPQHGVCRVVGYEKSEYQTYANARRIEYLAIVRISDDSVFLLESSRLEEIGIRPPVAVADIPMVIEQLRTPPRHISTLWARRWKAHAALLKTGEVLDIACVVRNMYHFAQTSTLSTAEKLMYDRSLTNLTNELAHSMNTSEEAAATLIADALKAGLKVKRKPKKA